MLPMDDVVEGFTCALDHWIDKRQWDVSAKNGRLFMQKLRYLYLIFADQLNQDSVLFSEFDPAQDRLWMAETRQASLAPLSHKQRTLLMLSAMRHFAAQLRQRHYPLSYYELGEQDDFIQALRATLHTYQPQQLRAVLPGDYQLCRQLQAFTKQQGIELIWLEDRHFLAEPGEFQHWLAQRKQPRMEYWYRQLRKRCHILMDGNQPVGGTWNLDKHNRKAFSAKGPGVIVAGPVFTKDALTEQVQQAIRTHLPELPGSWQRFNWPVTREQALQQLDFFIQQYLPLFGDYQDAMWQGEAFLYHSRLSAALNLKLLNPREVIAAAEQAYQQGQAPLNAVEGFIRQILGWREYVRGIYWARRHHWPQLNALDAQLPLPAVYWHGQTPMQCLQDAVTQVLEYGYGHHIQRLMVTGLYSLLLGVAPQAIHHWYQGMYVDALAWVETPNTLGMSQYADGGYLASKPYIASGAYLQRMSNYCQHCCFNPKQASGAKACPMTTLYWDFIRRHQRWLAEHPRLAMQVRHWHNKPASEQAAIEAQAEQLRLAAGA